MAEHEALVVPFGERASQFHEDTPGKSYGPADVHLPKAELPVTVNHGTEIVGLATGFAKTPTGITAQIKLGDRGEQLLAQGHVALSAEIAQPAEPGEPIEPDARIRGAIQGAKVGDLIGIALVVGIRPAFTGARVLDVAAAEMNPGATPAHPAMDLGEARQAVEDWSMLGVEHEVARARKAWENRAEDLHEADVAEEEQRLVAAGVPKARWPVHTHGREQWDVRQAQQVVADGELAARAFAERMAVLGAAAARQSRPWWRRLVK